MCLFVIIFGKEDEVIHIDSNIDRFVCKGINRAVMKNARMNTGIVMIWGKSKVGEVFERGCTNDEGSTRCHKRF